MIQLGYYAILAALFFCAYGMVASLLAARQQSVLWLESARRSVYANLVLIVAASVALWYLLLTDNFLVEYVASYSSRDMPTAFKFTAFWGGQKGSLLLWALVLAGFSAAAVWQNRHRNPRYMAYVMFTLLGIMTFFALLLNFAANPFETLPQRVADGRGLNPLLQNWYMIIHPPTLFLGYVGLAVPFAFAMGALMSGRLDNTWIRLTRRWMIVAWVFLTVGFTLGGRWAYEELGWGGYWAWDPVENASFMPWLVATAFLHSIMITEKKGMLKMWNFILVIIAFELSIFGTFITRSGVISSVHSFALSNIGPFFAAFLSVSLSFALFWVFYRQDELRSELRMRSFLSREASFLLNNWLLVSICFAIFWGTVFPILSEWVQGEKISVTAPFFNQVTWPLGLALLVLTGICPLIAWRQASWKNFRRNFLYPLAFGLAVGVLLWILGTRHWIALAFFSAAAFVMWTIAFEFFKGARARQSIRGGSFLSALVELTVMNKRRYGGFIIHAGTVLVFVGIIASSFFNIDRVFTVREGERFEIGGYTLQFNGLAQRQDPEKQVVFARLDVLEDGEIIDRLFPQRFFYHKSEQPTTEVAIMSRLTEDLYVVLSGWDDAGNVSFHVFVNPLVQLIWLGIAIMAMAGLFVLFPDYRPAAQRAAARATSTADAAA
ncbi:MAG: heme lyase CcmF/NrfE family subunit [Acidobacteriota bacterium]